MQSFFIQIFLYENYHKIIKKPPQYYQILIYLKIIFTFYIILNIIMGCWDLYCIICGCPCNATLNNEILNNKHISTIKKINKWFNKCTFLTKDNKIIHNCKEVSCNIDFVSPNKNRYTASVNDIELVYDYPHVKNIGLFIHTDCWKYIKIKFKIELKYGDLVILQENYKKFIKYNDIQKYWDQYFEYEQLINDNNIWMCESPLRSTKNASRINKIIKQLKIKRDRKGPTMSASFYKEGDIKYGNNNNFWIIKKGKWIEMKGDIVYEKKEYNKKLKIPQIGEYNTKPIFIKELIIENKKSYAKIISLV